jgi:hypothetical protein
MGKRRREDEASGKSKKVADSMAVDEKAPDDLSTVLDK